MCSLNFSDLSWILLANIGNVLTPDKMFSNIQGQAETFQSWLFWYLAVWFWAAGSRRAEVSQSNWMNHLVWFWKNWFYIRTSSLFEVFYEAVQGGKLLCFSSCKAGWWEDKKAWKNNPTCPAGGRGNALICWMTRKANGKHIIGWQHQSASPPILLKRENKNRHLCLFLLSGRQLIYRFTGSNRGCC